MNSAQTNRFTYSYRSQQSVGNILVWLITMGFYLHMKLGVQCIAAIIFAGSASAAEVKFDGTAIQKLLADTRYVSIHEDRATEQVFQANGLTFTIDVETQAQSLGSWRVEGDKYCSVWPPSQHWSCYDVLSTEVGVVFVSSGGTRYEMKKTAAN